MDDDLNNDMYRIIYFLTFILVFCLLPFGYIVSNTNLSQPNYALNCEKPLAIVLFIGENKTNKYKRYVYELEDGKQYTSTKRYSKGDKVCRY